MLTVNGSEKTDSITSVREVRRLREVRIFWIRYEADEVTVVA